MFVYIDRSPLPSLTIYGNLLPYLVSSSNGVSPYLPSLPPLLEVVPTMTPRSPLLKQLPNLPSSIILPWSAEVVQAYRRLQAGYRASQTALNLDESDPIRLGHHLHQVKTVMIPVVEVLGQQSSNPLPPVFTREISEAVLELVDGLQSAFEESTAAYVKFYSH